MVRGDGRRVARVSERVREELSRVLARDMSDPRLDHVTVVRVEVSGDLQVAHVYVQRSLDDSDQTRRQMLAGLKASAGRLRKLIAGGLGLRRTPELRFALDQSVDAQQRIDELLREIHEDDQQSGDDDGQDT